MRINQTHYKKLHLSVLHIFINLFTKCSSSILCYRNVYIEEYIEHFDAINLLFSLVLCILYNV